MLILRKKNTNDVLTLLEYKNNILLKCEKGYKRRFYLILADFIINYKEKIFIADIKFNMQYLIYYVLLKERKFVIEL